MISTPLGKADAMSARRAFTLSITSSAFWPKRCSAMPLATSPSPLSSVIPRRSSGPSSIRATSLSKTGVPFSTFNTTFDRFEFRQLHGPPADIHVTAADGIAHLRKRNTEGAQPVGVEDDVVLPDEAADACHLGDALGLGNAVAYGPILQGSQVGQRFVLRLQRILVDPADAGRVRPQRRRYARRESSRSRIEVFENARSEERRVGKECRSRWS